MNYEESINIFKNYYQNFDTSVQKINEKYHHTFRVVEYAKQIAQSINLSDSDTELVLICALFHDIARFKQWTKHTTYEDEKSFDHGTEGYKILKEIGIKNDIILKSTKYHNKYKIPNNLSEREKLFCNITRDADKLDIMIEQAKVCEDKSFTLPDAVMKSFRNHKQVKNGVMDDSSSIYNMLRHIAFIFDMNFDESLRIVKEKNIINLRCDEILSKFNEDSIKEIKEICNKYIEGRI